jgi:hypothetical protein
VDDSALARFVNMMQRMLSHMAVNTRIMDMGVVQCMMGLVQWPLICVLWLCSLLH